jgi:hypothetical protein
VNVGMGGSNPDVRFQKLIGGMNAVMDVVMKAPPNFNVQEFIKEASSNMGFRDGGRFWSEQVDPRLAKAMQMVQQLQQALQASRWTYQANAQTEQMKLLSNERVKAAELTVDKGRITGDLQIRQAELRVEEQRLALEAFKIQAESAGMANEHQLKLAGLSRTIDEAHTKLEAERLKLAGLAAKTQAEVEKANIGLHTERTKAVNEAQASDTVSKVTESMNSVAKEIAEAKAGIEAIAGLKDQVTQHGQALSLLLKDATTRKKPKGITLKKSGGKTSGLIIAFDDGTQEEMPVGATLQ